MKNKNTSLVVVILTFSFALSYGFYSGNIEKESIEKSTLIDISTIDSIQSPFCEGFNSTTFPPTGWTDDNTTLIYRSSSSGFQLGVGSAYFDFWNVVSGTGDLTTPVFTPTIAGDSLGFDFAYCPFGLDDMLTLDYSTNGGQNFIFLVNVLPIPGPPVHCARPFIPSSASDWNRESFGLPIGTNRIKFHATSGYGDGTYIDSVCVGHLPVGISSNNNEIPREFSLSQNYPNPFNPKTIINYELPITNYVKLSIFDILGKKVATLVNEKLQPGRYEVEWDGSNFSSGLYFYKLQTETFSETRKMLLVK